VLRLDLISTSHVNPTRSFLVKPVTANKINDYLPISLSASAKASIKA